MTTLAERNTDTQGRPSEPQSGAQDIFAHAAHSTPEHAKALVKFPTPLWMIEHDAKGAGNYETFWVEYRNVVLLLDHYLPGTLVDTEVVQATEDDVSHVKVTLTAVNSDGTIAKRVSAISGQRNRNKSGRDAFAEAKAQTYAFKNAAVMLGICADMDILLADQTLKSEIRQGKHRHNAAKRAQGEQNNNRPATRPAPSGRASGNGASGNGASGNGAPSNGASGNGASGNGASGNGAPSNGASGSNGAPRNNHPAGNKPAGNTASGNQPTGKMHSGQELEQKRQRLRELSHQMGMSDEDIRRRINESYDMDIEALPESDLDYLINASLKHLSKKATT
jgi:hypothetical protein